MNIMKYLSHLVVTLILLSFQINSLAQEEVICRDNNCSYSSGLSITNPLNLSGFTRFEINGLGDALEIKTPPTDTPRDFRSYVLTNNIAGENISIDVKSTNPTASAANFIFIGDSVKKMTVHNDGFSGNTYLNASQLCAKKIKDGAYTPTIRSKFLARRTLDPLLSSDVCDVVDLAMIQTEGAVSCDAGFSTIATPNLTATRWKPKRQCVTNAGRAMCIERTMRLRCDAFADRTASGCCNPDPVTGNTPASTAGQPAWVCEPLRCTATDSGWRRRYTFTMKETEYEALSTSGHSNEFICDQRIAAAVGSGDTGDSLTIVARTLSATASYSTDTTAFNISTPAGETFTDMEFAAGECGSYEDDPTFSFNEYSAFKSPNDTTFFDNGNGIEFIRMKGDGHKVPCTGVYTDHPIGSHCRNALEQASNSNICTMTYDVYAPGNQCWTELLPTCSGSYAGYPVGSYCRNMQIDKNCTGSYTNYPAVTPANPMTPGSFCHNLLKENACAGVYTDYRPGSACWNSLQPACGGVYTDYPAGSFCWHKLAPNCTAVTILSDPPTAEELFCEEYVDDYPANTPCVGDYTDYPAGHKCWISQQPACPGNHTLYTKHSYCYEKLAPNCSGSYADYAVGSHCYEKLTPYNCTGNFDDYPDGSFCHVQLRPTCSGVYTDYPEGSYCYNKLLPSCPGVHTDYPVGSYCKRKLSPGICDPAESYTSFPAGSYCWQELQPKCDDPLLPNHTDYPANSFCYNSLYPGQDEPAYEDEPQASIDIRNCSLNNGIGSVCWKDSFPECDPDENPDMTPGSFCWRKQRAINDGYCEGGYSDFPRGSYCWTDRRLLPDPFYYEPNSCAVKCSQSGGGVSCIIGTPDISSIEHGATTAIPVGQRVHRGGFSSFKVKIRTTTPAGLQKSHTTEVQIKVPQ